MDTSAVFPSSNAAWIPGHMSVRSPKSAALSEQKAANRIGEECTNAEIAQQTGHRAAGSHVEIGSGGDNATGPDLADLPGRLR